MADREQLDRWMAAAADGDRAAIDPLFQAIWPLVLGYATRFLGNVAAAEDCAQDALVLMFGQLEHYDRSRDALTWALTHTTWQCRTARRRMQRRGEIDALPEQAIDGAALAADRDLIRVAIETLQTLSPRDVDIVTAAVADDDELRESLAPATFRKRLERALGRLRTSWRSRHGTL